MFHCSRDYHGKHSEQICCFVLFRHHLLPTIIPGSTDTIDHSFNRQSVEFIDIVYNLQSTFGLARFGQFVRPNILSCRRSCSIVSPACAHTVEALRISEFHEDEMMRGYLHHPLFGENSDSNGPTVTINLHTKKRFHIGAFACMGNHIPPREFGPGRPLDSTLAHKCSRVQGSRDPSPVPLD